MHMGFSANFIALLCHIYLIVLYFTYWIKKIGHVFDREYVVYETALKETYQTKKG